MMRPSTALSVSRRRQGLREIVRVGICPARVAAITDTYKSVLQRVCRDEIIRLVKERARPQRDEGNSVAQRLLCERLRPKMRNILGLVAAQDGQTRNTRALRRLCQVQIASPINGE